MIKQKFITNFNNYRG